MLNLLVVQAALFHHININLLRDLAYIDIHLEVCVCWFVLFQGGYC